MPLTHRRTVVGVENVAATVTPKAERSAESIEVVMSRRWRDRHRSSNDKVHGVKRATRIGDNDQIPRRGSGKLRTKAALVVSTVTLTRPRTRPTRR